MQTITTKLAAFVFYYPLFMSYLWMLGAAIFRFRRERDGRAPSDPPIPCPAPPVSLLIPCFNEAENVAETLDHALAVDYPEFEIVAIDDGSTDATAEILDRIAAREPRLRVVHLAQNQGKAMALAAGSLLARHEILVGIDGDALLDRHCVSWLVRHFVEDSAVAAVTGNPRIRNRSTLLGRVQVGEFSSIVGLLKRAQQTFGAIFTVSGVVTAYRRAAVHEVGSWSPEILTEDIDVTWKLQRAGWKVKFEPNALVWILMPETLRGLWRQRLRWAMGGAQVLRKNLNVLLEPRQSFMWPLVLELCTTVVWSYVLIFVMAASLVGFVWPSGTAAGFMSPLVPHGGGLVLGATCLLQFAFSEWLDSRYERGLGRYYFFMIWYPFVFWLINTATLVVAYPMVFARPSGRARWKSPDRGIRPLSGS